MTNERRGIWSCDLRANERPKKKLHVMAQTDRQTNGHGDSMTESAQWADSVKRHSHCIICELCGQKEVDKKSVRAHARSAKCKLQAKLRVVPPAKRPATTA